MTYYFFQIGSDDDELSNEDIRQLPKRTSLPENAVHIDTLNHLNPLSPEFEGYDFFSENRNTFDIYLTEDETIYFKEKI